VLSYGVVAGHALGFNYGSAGVALIGDFQQGTPSEAMLARLEDLLVYLHGRYQIDPRSTLDFARSNRLWRYDLPAMPGHRDCNSTECPGDAVYVRLDGLRERVVARLDGGQAPRGVIVEAPAERNVWPGPATYAWDGQRPYDRVFEGFQREIGADPAEHLVGYDPLSMPEHVLTIERGATFLLQRPGQYTLHVRPADSPFADRRTVLVDRHVVADNADPNVEREGTWTRSREVPDFYGSDYELAQPGSAARFAWTLAAPEVGRYAVQACWVAASDRATAAPYRLGAGPTVTVDQTIRGGSWVELGTVDLQPGEPCRVELGSADDGVVIADAVRLIALDG
jgi:hypothetical protein